MSSVIARREMPRTDHSGRDLRRGASPTAAVIGVLLKMESAVTTPVQGTVRRIAVEYGVAVEPGDLLMTVEPQGRPSG